MGCQSADASFVLFYSSSLERTESTKNYEMINSDQLGHVNLCVQLIHQYLTLESGASCILPFSRIVEKRPLEMLHLKRRLNARLSGSKRIILLCNTHGNMCQKCAPLFKTRIWPHFFENELTNYFGKSLLYGLQY